MNAIVAKIQFPGPWILLLLLFSLFLATCALDPSSSDDSGTPSSTSTTTGGGGTASVVLCPGGTLDATWGCIQALVFVSKCVSCHGGSSPKGGMNLEEAHSPNIVGGASIGSSLALIEPGAPDASYLIWKLEGMGPNGEAITGLRMPIGGPFLGVGDMDFIRQWVTEGAATP